MKTSKMKGLFVFLFVSLILAGFAGNAKAYTWDSEDGGQASISGSYYAGIGQYSASDHSLLLGMRCIIWQEATAKGCMYVCGYATSTGTVTGSIYWYTKGNLAAGGLIPGGEGASILIKFQAYDLTSGGLYEKVILNQNAVWSDDGTWRWDSMSVPLYYGHEYNFSLYAEAHAYCYDLGASISDFGGIWWSDSKIQWGYIDVPNMILVPPHTLTINSGSGGTTDPAPGTYVYAQGDIASVQATPVTNYGFSYWMLDGNKVYSNPINIVMSTDHTLTPYFLPLVTLTLSVPQAPAQGYDTDGTPRQPVSIWVDGNEYQFFANTKAYISLTAGTPHTVQAQYSFAKEEWKPGYYYIYTFKYWNDGVTSNPRTINISSDLTLVAYYLRSKYAIL